jgi:hypothetical protein
MLMAANPSTGPMPLADDKPSATAGEGPLRSFLLLSRTGYLGTVRDADSRLWR